MKDELSACLRACADLTYQSIHIECAMFDSFRRLAWAIMRDPQCQWSPQCETIRRKLWRTVYALSCTPQRWEAPLSELLGVGQRDFAKIVEDFFGREQSSNARQLNDIWEAMCGAAVGGGPIHSVIAETIESLRDEMADFRIVAQKKEHATYKRILTRLELSNAELCCTPSMIKYEPPFDCLVSSGPFRQDDFLLTAPRYKRLINIRWKGDEDFGDFPNYITSRSRAEDEPAFPQDFPVNVTAHEVNRKIEIPIPIVSVNTTGSEWSYHDFERLYIPRKKRTNRLMRKRGVAEVTPKWTPGDRTTLYTKLVFFDDSYLIQDFDQQGKPRFQLSIDPESGLEVTKRRPSALENEIGSDEGTLQPGMLVIIEPHATTRLSEAASDDRMFDAVHLPRWKKRLRERVASLRAKNQSILFAMQAAGLAGRYKNIENAVDRWCSESTQPPEAPGDVDNFKKLVGEFLSYDDWQAAWEEVEFIRGTNKGIGISRESRIDRYLAASVKSKLDEILGNQVTLLSVEGFDADVVIIELSDIQFLSEDHVARSELDRITGLSFE